MQEKSLWRAFADLARHRDSTRLISAALLGHFDSAKVFHLNDPLNNKLDVVSFNEYAGWYFLRLIV